mmetsp:Transcript_54275/g.126716  ORF Transcript_54275/g.126716 Transcript_54275/m.126716 type:complete len:208 (-) Transcript_54275:911-1534(-)
MVSAMGNLPTASPGLPPSPGLTSRKHPSPSCMSARAVTKSRCSASVSSFCDSSSSSSAFSFGLTSRTSSHLAKICSWLLSCLNSWSDSQAYRFAFGLPGSSTLKTGRVNRRLSSRFASLSLCIASTRIFFAARTLSDRRSSSGLHCSEDGEAFSFTFAGSLDVSYGTTSKCGLCPDTAHVNTVRRYFVRTPYSLDSFSSTMRSNFST